MELLCVHLSLVVNENQAVKPRFSLLNLRSYALTKVQSYEFYRNWYQWLLTHGDTKALEGVIALLGGIC